MSTLNSVGHPTPRIDALKRVTGAATYTADIHIPGMLYARVLRSPHPHARIRKIDVFLGKVAGQAGAKRDGALIGCRRNSAGLRVVENNA